MKKNKLLPRTDIFVLLCAVAALVILLILTTTESDGLNEPDYTVFSTNTYGASLFYDTLMEIGYPVDIGYNELKAGISTKSAHIIINPDTQYYDSLHRGNLLQWVLSGGFLVMLEPYGAVNSLEIEMNSKPIYYDEFLAYYSYGQGFIVFGDPSIIHNSALLVNNFPAMEVAAALYNYEPEFILFNEYYHGYNGQRSLWRDLPVQWRTVVFQTVILAAVLVVYFGKRFGAAEKYYEEEERKENEFLISLARLYKRAKIRI